MSTRLTPELTPETALSLEYGFGEGLVSDEARTTLQAYSEATEDRRAYEHPLRVAVILRDFVGDVIPESIYDVAALHDVVQRTETGNVHQEAALDALYTYSTRVKTTADYEHSGWQYISKLLSDMDTIEAYSERGRHIPIADRVVSDLLRSDSNIKVPQNAWDVRSSLVELPMIKDLLVERVTAVSALVKAAEMLDNLRHPAPGARAVLQDVFDAESFYAPMCEAMGFSGMSMALRSEAAALRLRRSGKERVLNAAGDLLSPLGDREQVISDVSGLFHHLLDGEAIVETPLLDVSRHGIMTGHSVLHAHELSRDSTAWVLWRVKSLGSLALKLDRSSGKPADILGVTIVVKDIQELAVTYAGIVRCIKLNHVVEENPAPSRTQAYSIQGDESYIETIRRHLGEAGVMQQNDVHVVHKDNGHRVVKATFLYKPHTIDTARPAIDIPVELQVQTKADWTASHTGPASHVFYKGGSGPSGDHTELEVIKQQSEYLSTPSPNPQSMARGKRLRMLVAQHGSRRA